VCLERTGWLDQPVPAAAICEDQLFLKMTDERWRKTLSVNSDGAL